ncbi:MAG: hypothetical protein WBC71_12570, partial [Salaquimonas sp.]
MIFVKHSNKGSILALALAVALGLAGCTSLVPSPPSNTYDLSAPQSFAGLRGGSNAQILILEPSA